MAFSRAVHDMHAAWCARVEAQTPGLRCPMPKPTETSDQTRSRFALMHEQSYRLRLRARDRAIAAEWPGVTRDTPFEAPAYLDDTHDPVGDFMRAEVAAKARLSRVIARAA